ncbi:hypothetical protein NKH10_28290 [Mesorhizobium sp. M1340]|uniref:hypothetical protein n=1 Tax=unclassified Mesorhizobium TaxID=325217 RepID=UPI00333B09EE
MRDTMRILEQGAVPRQYLQVASRARLRDLFERMIFDNNDDDMVVPRRRAGHGGSSTIQENANGQNNQPLEPL